MNIHQLISGAIGSINPFVIGRVFVNQGWTTLPDGNRVPNYESPIDVSMQVQALAADELHQVEGLNIQGIKRAIYLNGRINGIVRMEEKGGDLVVLPDGTKWLVVLVLEYWPDWCKVAVEQQLRVSAEPSLPIRITANGMRRVTSDGRTRVVVLQ